MAYPSLPQGDGSVLVPRSGFVLRYASNGTVRARNLTSATRYDPTVVHPALTAAQWATLQAFYEANRGLQFSFTFVPSGAVLTCLFSGSPLDFKPIMLAGGIVAYAVTARLVQAN